MFILYSIYFSYNFSYTHIQFRLFIKKSINTVIDEEFFFNIS